MRPSIRILDECGLAEESILVVTIDHEIARLRRLSFYRAISPNSSAGVRATTSGGTRSRC